MSGWLGLLAFFTLLLLFSFTPFSFELKYVRNQSEDNVCVNVYWLKNLKIYTMQLSNQAIGWEENNAAEKNIAKRNVDPLNGFMNNLSKFLQWLTIKPAIKPLETEKNYTQPSELERNVQKKGNYTVYKTLKLLVRFTKIHNQFIYKLSNMMTCEKFRWSTRIGFEDAATTGIFTGYLWLLKSLILNFFSNQVTMKTNPLIHVIPVFGKNNLDIHFECILKIRVGHVINAGYYLMKLMPKGGSMR